MTFPPAMSADQGLQAVPPDLGGQPPQPQSPPPGPPPPLYPGHFSTEVEAICKAITKAAMDCQATSIPADVRDFGTGIFQLAQAIEKLMPAAPPPVATQASPDTVLKVGADAQKHGAQIAHDALQAEKQRAHDMAAARLQSQQKKQMTVQRDQAGNMTGLTQGG